MYEIHIIIRAEQHIPIFVIRKEKKKYEHKKTIINAFG